MNCEKIRAQLVETGRGRELPSDLRAMVFDHAAVCFECASLLDNQSRLTVALAEVASHAESAPARAEHAIRRQLPVPIRKPARRPWLWAGISAAAAGLVMAAVLTSPQHPAKETRPAVASVHTAANPVHEAAAVAAGAPQTAARQERASLASDWNNDDFVTLPYAEEVSPDEQADIVRVSLPRESLLALGVPVRADHFGEQVLADVLIGTDGTARAIRISD